MVRLAREGNRKAQKEIYERLGGKMLSVCLRYVQDRETALDMLQDGFVALFAKLGDYKGDGSFEGWARRVFATTCLMYLRKKDALKMSEDLETAGDIGADTPSQRSDLSYKEILSLVMQMPSGYRTVFNLYVMEGYSHEEIGQMLGISQVTSRSQLNRARKWLQEKLKER